MSTKKVIKTKSLANPTQAGEYYRLICMTGKNKGIVYYLNSNRVVLGRSETADIAVWDQKSSREHCELVKHGDTYIMTDLDSQNGIIINDLKATQYRLKDGDKLIIGQTVFKYNIINVSLPAILDEEDDDDEVVESSSSEKEGETPEEAAAGKRKKLIIAGAVIVVVALFLGEDIERQEEENQRGGASSRRSFVLDNESRSGLDSRYDMDPEVRSQTEAHIHRGLREYREKNYFRAIREFNLALVLSPNHPSTSYYLSKTKQRLDEEIEDHFDRARLEIEALKYSEAVISYCSILRLLQLNPNDQRYKDARESLDIVIDQMGARRSEVRCIEE